jgi:HK97 gp10 family phage protein
VAKAGGGVIITGDKALDALLKGLPAKVQKKLSRQATRKAAKEIVLPDAKARVPVNTGDLEESLTVKAMRRSRTRFGHEVRTKDVFYQGDQFYGAFIEFGTKERRHKSGKSVGRIDPAKGFAYLRPAIYDNEDRIEQLYVTAMRELIAELPTVK